MAVLLERGATVEQIIKIVSSILTEDGAIDVMTRLAQFPASLSELPYDPSLLDSSLESQDEGTDQSLVPPTNASSRAFWGPQ